MIFMAEFVGGFFMFLFSLISTHYIRKTPQVPNSLKNIMLVIILILTAGVLLITLGTMASMGIFYWFVIMIFIRIFRLLRTASRGKDALLREANLNSVFFIVFLLTLFGSLSLSKYLDSSTAMFSLWGVVYFTLLIGIILKKDFFGKFEVFKWLAKSRRY
jgi:hypothetical protein